MTNYRGEEEDDREVGEVVNYWIKAANRIRALEGEVSATLRALAKVHRIAETGIIDEVTELENKLAASRSEGKKDDNSFKERFMYKYEIDHLKSDGTSVIRGSVFLMAFGFLENMLTQICEKFSKGQLDLQLNRINSKILIGDLDGSGIGRARLFLSKILEIPMSDFFGRKEKLLVILRNAFAHNGGILHENRFDEVNNLKAKINVGTYGSICDFELEKLTGANVGYRIKLGQEFILGVLDSIREVLANIFKEIKPDISNVE